MNTGIRSCAALLTGLLLATGGVHAADSWPAKPITIVVPFGTGSMTDTISRLYAKFINEETGGTVIVDNRPGANAMVGTQLAAKAPADGYTVLMGSGTGNAANYALFADRITYKAEDFDAVAVVFVSPPVIFAAPGVTGDTVQKTLASAKAASGGASCGSGNAVTLVACELLKRQSGVELVSVNYKGNGQSLADLAGRQITLAIADMGAGGPFVAGGRVRPVAVAAKQRLPGLPGVPSASEQGLDMDFLSWNTVFVPAGTPSAVIEKLNAAARRMLRSPEGIALQQASNGLEVDGERTSAQRFVADEIAKWERYVRDSGVKLQ